MAFDTQSYLNGGAPSYGADDISSYLQQLFNIKKNSPDQAATQQQSQPNPMEQSGNVGTGLGSAMGIPPAPAAGSIDPVTGQPLSPANVAMPASPANPQKMAAALQNIKFPTGGISPIQRHTPTEMISPGPMTSAAPQISRQPGFLWRPRNRNNMDGMNG